MKRKKKLQIFRCKGIHFRKKGNKVFSTYVSLLETENQKGNETKRVLLGVQEHFLTEA